MDITIDQHRGPLSADDPTCVTVCLLLAMCGNGSRLLRMEHGVYRACVRRTMCMTAITHGKHLTLHHQDGS